MCSYDNSTPIRSPQIVTCLPVAFVLCKLCSEHMNTITIYGMIVMKLCVGRNKLDVSFGERERKSGKSVRLEIGRSRVRFPAGSLWIFLPLQNLHLVRSCLHRAS